MAEMNDKNDKKGKRWLWERCHFRHASYANIVTIKGKLKIFFWLKWMTKMIKRKKRAMGKMSFQARFIRLI
jgi:hypothetical protein